jgi:hypothetical protein
MMTPRRRTIILKRSSVSQLRACQKKQSLKKGEKSKTKSQQHCYLATVTWSRCQSRDSSGCFTRVDNISAFGKSERNPCRESEAIRRSSISPGYLMIQFVSIVNFIEMKWMKVICNLKNIPNIEFQHGMESRLIQVIKTKMHMIQFVSIVNWIQMKLMKVIYNLKNIPNKEFQHWMESKLIEVMKMQMHLIQFVSIVNLIQMKLMKGFYNLKNMMNKEFQHLMESQLIEVMKMKMPLIQFVSIVNLIQMKLMKVIYKTKNILNKEFQHLME